MLDQILVTARRRAAALRPQAAELRARAAAMSPGHEFGAALAQPGLQVIAEIKRRSPSAGDLAPDLDPATQAQLYVSGGAAAISVLTEPDFFAGSLNDLQAVREAVTVPVLRKDFIVDEVQVWESKAAGADALLLIVAALDETTLTGLMAAARRAGIAALVEAHDATEVAAAVRSGAEIVGVNNRDLKTFVTDLATAEALAAAVTAPVKVAESGVSTPTAAARMAAAGYHAVLVGEALVRSTDPAALVSSLRAAAP